MHEQAKMVTCSGPCVHLAAKTVVLILVYYALSIGLTFYQRKFLQVSTSVSFHSSSCVCMNTEGIQERPKQFLCHKMVNCYAFLLCRHYI
jgi:hypothetical protein